METTNAKIIISGGGTGGHIFPAISIANALKTKEPQAEILFVGADNRMEMEKIPSAGYPIVGLPISGFDRSHLLKNVKTLWNIARSLCKARKLIRDFRPQVAVGVGGYASGPLLRAAASMGIPTILQEQNSYAGVTNKLLAAKAVKICVAYQGMEKFFPKEKILLTGNPVRQDLSLPCSRSEALAHFGLEDGRPVLLVLGGSLGARTINNSMLHHIQTLENSGVQVLWQTGKYYYKEMLEKTASYALKNVHVLEFVSRMDYAYAISDLVVSRAGAGSISEFCLLGKAVLLIPSPNVAEDHQTKNAMALVEKGAAEMIRDDQAEEKMIPSALALIANPKALESLREHSLGLAEHHSAERIADEILKQIKR